MGCNASNASSALAATAASKAEELSGGDFKVTLKRSGVEGESLGLDVSSVDGKILIVQKVHAEGLVPSWNGNCENTPELEVHANYQILVVNQVSGNAELMEKELEQTSLTLLVKRADPQESQAKSGAAAAGTEQPAAPTPTEPEAGQAPEPAAEQAPKPVAEKAAEPAAEQAREPEAEQAPEPAAERAPRRVAEQAPEPAAEQAEAPAAESAVDVRVETGSPQNQEEPVKLEVQVGEEQPSANEDTFCKLGIFGF